MSQSKKPKESQQEILRQANTALFEINRGYSLLQAAGRDFYFKHFTLEDSLRLEEEFDQNIRHAEKSGIKTEHQLITDAIKRGIWTIKKEEEQKALFWSINKLEAAERKASDPTQKLAIRSSIEGKRKTAEEILDNRKKLTSFSAENFADNKRIKSLVSSSCFYDKEFTNQIPEDVFFEHSIACFSKIAHLSKKEFILKVAYNTSFFELFVLHYRQPHVIFGKAGLSLTIFQKNLLAYSNSLLSKMRNVSIPDSILNDPVKILEYEETKSGDKVSEGIEDLKQKSAARGGTLNPEDFLS